MSTPFGGNDPQQWGQGGTPSPSSGGFPEQNYAQQAGNHQPQYGQAYPQQSPQQQPQYGQPQYGQPQQQQPYGQYPYGHPGGQQFPQQPYGGQSFGQPPGTGEQKKGGKIVLLVVAAVVVVVAVVCVLGFFKPGFFVTTVLDQNAVQNGVKTVLSAQPPKGYGQPVSSVSCPAKQEVKAGGTFDCTAVVDGQRKTVTVTVKDSDGNYEVGQPR